MSVQVAKSTSGTTSGPGRRTPLSLSGSVGKTTKTQSSTDTEKTTTKSDIASNLSASSNSKTVSKNDKNEITTTDLKKSNDKNDKKSANSDNPTENTNSAKEKGSDKKKDDKSKDKDLLKKDDKKQENGLSGGKNTSKSNGHKDEDKKAEKGGEKNDKTTGQKENLRKKDLKEREKEKESEPKETKVDEKACEIKKVDEKSIVKHEDTEQKDSKKKMEEGNEKQLKDGADNEHEQKIKLRKEPETPKKDEKKSKEVTSATPTKEVASKPSVYNQSITSLALEKDLKGFGQDGEEMESLIIDSESDTNGPSETSTPGKILKIKQSPPSSVQKTSYEHRAIYEKYEYVRIKEDRPDISSVSSTPLERPQFTGSYRGISGRRSLRPTKEYSFQNNYRESYRKINTELDYTTSSMNVTVGSEIPNESSFSIFGRGKKRERTPPVTSTNDSNSEIQLDVELSPKSPKRARLDFSGIIGIVASPVTLLRAKLSRTKLQCSTPNGKVTSTTKDDEEGVENVSVIANEEMSGNDVADTFEDVNIKDAELAEEEFNNEFKDEGDVDISESLDDFKKPQEVTASMENVNKRRMCNVM